MSLFPLSRAAQWLDARLIGEDVAIESVGVDSRQISPGQLFVALTGERFDGHAFAEEAYGKGAAALLVSRELDCPVAQLLVSDTRLALGRLAAAWRNGLPGRVVAVTGSNGKTTAKEMIAALLGAAGSVSATKGNFNNDIGLPLTLLRAANEDFLVTEMGANHPGEIAVLSRMARPDVALITNAGRAHLEGFGTLKGVAQAKGEIIQGLSPDGVVVLNADDAFFPLWRELAAGRRILCFGESPDADIYPLSRHSPIALSEEGFETAYQVRTPSGDVALKLALPGRHNLHNALAAIAVAEALALNVCQLVGALSALTPVRGRLYPLPGPDGACIIDDSYNANPDSLNAALQVMEALPGPGWLVLGDLAELGADARSLHHALGVKARQAGVERLWAVGDLSREAVRGFGSGARHFTDKKALVAALEQELTGEDVILVKGSRSAAMDQVVSLLTHSGER